MGQNMLGILYEHGEGVTQDKAEAARWYLKAAEQGNGDAQLSIGMMYDSGDGVEQNDQEAIRWYRKVIEHGDQAATVAEYSIQQILQKNKGKH